MDCPGCKKGGAYVGLQWIHCLNKECHYYDAKYAAKVKKEKADAFNSAVDRLIMLNDEQAVLFDDLDELQPSL